MKIDIDFSDQELKDLKTVLDQVQDSFDFHGDLIPLETPIIKLVSWLQKEGFE